LKDHQDNIKPTNVLKPVAV